MMRLFAVGAATAVLLTTTPTFAQWTGDPFFNTPLGVGPPDQTSPLIRPSPDGGAWVTWFEDDPGPGLHYRPVIQRVNAAGILQFPLAGVVLANRQNSAVFNYDLKVDSEGNAIVVFDDDSTPPSVLTVQKVSPSGTLPWGPTGVQVPGSDGALGPKVAVDGTQIIVAFALSPVITFQRINSDGTIDEDETWTVTEANRYHAISDLQTDDDGGVIALWVRGEALSPTTSRKGLRIQKWDSVNDPVWNGGTPIEVYTSQASPAKSIQNGYFPTIVTDGNGGAIVSFYDIGATRNAWLQHVLANGTLRFGPPGSGGVQVSTVPAATELRLSASVGYDSESDEYTVAYVRSNPGQSQWGVSAQRITADSTRLWGAGAGTSITALGPLQPSFVHGWAEPTGTSYVVWQQTVPPGNVQHIQAAELDQTGALTWDPTIFEVSTRNSAKSRLGITKSATEDMLMVAWADGAFGSQDVIADRIVLGGDEEPCAADFNDDDMVDSSDFFAYLAPFFAGDLAADFDESGAVDSSDFFAFLAAFLAGCA